MEEDQEWISQILQGDKQAYAPLINKYKNKVYDIVYRIVNQSQDAQDITQECFMKAYHYLDRYDPARKFSSWLYRIAVNHCLDVYSSKRKREDQQVNLEEVVLFDNACPETIYIKREAAAEIKHLVDLLPDSYRIIILLRYSNELSYQEISEILNVPLNTVQVRLHRAKQKLRELCLINGKGEGVS